MTLAVSVLVMIAVGMFWYWQSLPKQQAIKKYAAAGTHAARRDAAKKPVPASAPANSSASQRESNSYRAVSVQTRDDACDTARTLAGKRFLVNSAPILPVPGCSCANCHCSYAHHADRRGEDDDRRSPHALTTELYTRTATERRTRRGRRRTDID